MTNKIAKIITIVFIVAFVLLLLCACHETRRRNAYIDTHPELDMSTRGYISKGYFVNGMSKDEVRASIGGPERIRKSAVGHKIMEMWIYGWTYLYFYKDVLIAWDN